MASVWVDQFKVAFKCPINTIPISFSSLWPLMPKFRKEQTMEAAVCVCVTEPGPAREL